MSRKEFLFFLLYLNLVFVFFMFVSTYARTWIWHSQDFLFLFFVAFVVVNAAVFGSYFLYRYFKKNFFFVYLFVVFVLVFVVLNLAQRASDWIFVFSLFSLTALCDGLSLLFLFFSAVYFVKKKHLGIRNKKLPFKLYNSLALPAIERKNAFLIILGNFLAAIVVMLYFLVKVKMTLFTNNYAGVVMVPIVFWSMVGYELWLSSVLFYKEPMKYDLHLLGKLFSVFIGFLTLVIIYFNIVAIYEVLPF